MGLEGLGADTMHDVPRLKLRLAEDILVFLADQQAGQGQQLLIGPRPQPRHQLLGLGFQLGRQRLMQRHRRTPWLPCE